MAAALESRTLLTSTLPTIGSLAFTNSSTSYGTANGNFAGTLINASPSSYYSIEIDTNNDQLPDFSGSSMMDSFQIYGSLAIGTSSVKARVSEYDMATGQQLSSAWQAFSVSDGVVAPTLPTIASLAFTNSSTNYGMANGSFGGSLSNASPSDYYSIEIDTNNDQSPDLSGSSMMGSFQVYGSVPVGTASVKARVSVYDMATGQYLSSPWQAYSVSDGVVANTLPVLSGVAFTSGAPSAAGVTGDFTGTLTDTTAAMYYTVQIDTNGDQQPDLSGMVGPGTFTLSGSVPVGVTGITVRVEEYVSTTGQYESTPWQAFTIDGAASATETGTGSGSGGTTTPPATGTEPTTGGTVAAGSGTGSGAGSGTGSASSTTSGGSTTTSPAWTMANGTVLDTSAADAAFASAVFSALVSYENLLSIAAADRLADDLMAWLDYEDLMATADSTWTASNATALSNHTSAVDTADLLLELADLWDQGTYDDQIAIFQADYDAEVARAKGVKDAAYAAADAAQRASDLTSYNTLKGVMDGADLVYAATQAIQTAWEWLQRTGADLTYSAAQNAANAAMNAEYAAFNADPSSYSSTYSSWLDLEYDLQFNSDRSAAEGMYTGALSTAQSIYDAAEAAAWSDYEFWEDLAYADYTDALADNDDAYELAFMTAITGYWADEDTHAATADAAVADAALWRDFWIDIADTDYDDAVADAADLRATAKATHLATYEADEGAAWLLLQTELTASAATHATDIAAAEAAANATLDAAWEAYDLVVNDPLSTSAQKDAALAARLIAVAGALSTYNNSIASADARQTNDDTDSWAVYDIAVNGFLTTYWNDEAQADADEAYLVNAAYVTWANDVEFAWADYSNEVAGIRGQQVLDDAQSANDAAHDIHSATVTWYTDNAADWDTYVDAVVPLEADYYSAVQTAWTDFATARNNAHATKEIAVADAKAAAFRRWATDAAGGYFGIYVGYLADMEEAAAARTETYELALASYLNAMTAADALWVETVLPAWVTYEDEVSDHAVTNVNDSSPAWETAENDIASAALAYTTAAVPVGTQLTVDLNENYSAWVNDVALADEAYWNTLADNDVTWVEDTNAADEGFAVDLIVSESTFTQFVTSLNSSLVGTVGEASTNWAGSIAGQLTGVTYTPPASGVMWPVSSTNGSASGSANSASNTPLENSSGGAASGVAFQTTAGSSTGSPTNGQLIEELAYIDQQLPLLEVPLHLGGYGYTAEYAATVEAALLARREQILLELQQNPVIIRYNEWVEQQANPPACLTEENYNESPTLRILAHLWTGALINWEDSYSVADGWIANDSRRFAEWGENQGEVNALRHAYWQALMTVALCERTAIRVGDAHEYGEVGPDNRADVHNNIIGREIGKKVMKDLNVPAYHSSVWFYRDSVVRAAVQARIEHEVMEAFDRGQLDLNGE